VDFIVNLDTAVINCRHDELLGDEAGRMALLRLRI